MSNKELTWIQTCGSDAIAPADSASHKFVFMAKTNWGQEEISVDVWLKSYLKYIICADQVLFNRSVNSRCPLKRSHLKLTAQCKIANKIFQIVKVPSSFWLPKQILEIVATNDGSCKPPLSLNMNWNTHSEISLDFELYAFRILLYNEVKSRHGIVVLMCGWGYINHVRSSIIHIVHPPIIYQTKHLFTSI